MILLGPDTISDFPTKFTNIGVTPLPHTGGYLSYSVGIFIVLAIVFGVVLHATPLGRSLFVMGANEEAARFAGIRVKRTKLILFVVSGLVSRARRDPLHLPPLDGGAGQRARASN